MFWGACHFGSETEVYQETFYFGGRVRFTLRNKPPFVNKSSDLSTKGWQLVFGPMYLSGLRTNL